MAAVPANDENDSRFTAGLLYDVLSVLDKRGYKRGKDSRVYAHALVELLHLTRAYEGRDVLSGQVINEGERESGDGTMTNDADSGAD